MTAPPTLLCLVGTGRCGSTLLLNLLARHPALAWPSGWTNAFPQLPILALSHRLWRLKDPGDFRGWRGFPKPAEPNGALEHYFGDLYVSEDPKELPRSVIDQCKEHFSRVSLYHGCERIIMKVVGFPVRISLFLDMWGQGRFVHVTRGLKPSVSSTLTVSFYSGWGHMEGWQWPGIPGEMFEFHNETEGCEAVGVAMGLWLQRRRIAEQRHLLSSEQYREITYIDLVTSPLENIRTICDWLDIGMSDDYTNALLRAPVERSNDEKWKETLSKQQVAHLDII